MMQLVKTAEKEHKQNVSVRFEPSFFFFKCLLNFDCELKLLKLKGTR